jgi:hypothetical protein
MGMRRDTKNRLTLYRSCGTCGREFRTTADCPWMRQMLVEEGGKRRQLTTYFCSSKCYAASYKYKSWYDGKAEQRRAEKEANRDIHEKNRRYYQAHIEQERQRARERYWADPEGARADQRYQRAKRKAAANVGV